MPRGGVEVQIYSFLNLGARWGGWSMPRPGRFTPGKDPVSIVQKAGWAPGPVWTGAENLAHNGIRSPDRPARSKSLYRKSYPLMWRPEGKKTTARSKSQDVHPQSGTLSNITLHNKTCCHRTRII